MVLLIIKKNYLITLCHLFGIKFAPLKIDEKNNPPRMVVEFFNEQKNIKNINCYSNDGGKWKKPNLKFDINKLIVNFEDPFIPRRGRINCSLMDNGKWRWFGTQFIVSEN